MLYCPNFFWNVLQVWMTGKDVYLQMTWSWPDKTWNILCSYCLQWNTSQSKFRNHYFLFLFAFSILSQLFLIWGCSSVPCFLGCLGWDNTPQMESSCSGQSRWKREPGERHRPPLRQGPGMATPLNTWRACYMWKMLHYPQCSCLLVLCVWCTCVVAALKEMPKSEQSPSPAATERVTSNTPASPTAPWDLAQSHRSMVRHA